MAATRTACFLRATVQERGSAFAGLRTSSSTISTFLFLKQDFVETISQPFSTRGRLWGALRKANASVSVGGSSAPPLDVSQAAKPHLSWHRPRSGRSTYRRLFQRAIWPA